jgi:hypothetical protein
MLPAAPARFLHDHRLAPLFAHLLRDHAPEDVGGAAGRPGNDHAHGLGGITLRQRNQGKGENEEE